MTEKELYNQLEEYDKEIIKLAKENKKLKLIINKTIEYIQSYNIDFNNTEFSECPITIGELENILKTLKGE